MKTKFAVLGGSFVDVYIYGDEPHRCEILEDCGGSGLNVAFALQQLGFEVVFFSNVGDDHRGDFFLNKLKKLGFDTRYIKRKRGPTGLHISINDRTVAVERGVNNLELDLDWKILSECRLAFVNTEIPRETIERFLKDFQGTVFLDVGPRRILDPSVRSLHQDLLLIGNASQCELLPCDIVKMGLSGAKWGELFVPTDGQAHPYTTGCGDVFDAVLIHCLLQSKDRKTALETAVRVSEEAAKTFKTAFAKAQAVKDLLSASL